MKVASLAYQMPLAILTMRRTRRSPHKDERDIVADALVKADAIVGDRFMRLSWEEMHEASGADAQRQIAVLDAELWRAAA